MAINSGMHCIVMCLALPFGYERDEMYVRKVQCLIWVYYIKQHENTRHEKKTQILKLVSEPSHAHKAKATKYIPSMSRFRTAVLDIILSLFSNF